MHFVARLFGSVFMRGRGVDGARRRTSNKVIFQIAFSNGSIETIMYEHNREPVPAELLRKTFGGGKVGVIENLQSLVVLGNGKRL